MQIYLAFQYLFSISSTLIKSVLGLSFKLYCVFKSLSVLSDSDQFQWLQELVFHPGVCIIPDSLCACYGLWLVVLLIFSFLFPVLSMLLPKVTNMTKWWHFQFVGTHALRQDMLYLWGEIGTLGIQNRVKEDWIIDEMLFDFLKNPKSRAADCKTSSMSHESCPRTSWFVLGSHPLFIGFCQGIFFWIGFAHPFCEPFQ